MKRLHRRQRCRFPPTYRRFRGCIDGSRSTFRWRRDILKASRDGYGRGRDVFILPRDGRRTVPVFRRQVTLMPRAGRELCAEGK